MKAFFQWLKNESITPNGLLVLYALSTNEDVSDQVNVYTELSKLEARGYISMQVSETEAKFIITLIGEKLLESADKSVWLGNEIKLSKTIRPMTEFTKYIEQYRLLFPPGKNGNSVYRSSVPELKTKFNWFFTQYPDCDWDTVLTATKAYLADTQFKYIRTSSYFIKKMNPDKTFVSDLAAYCDLVKDEGYEPNAKEIQAEVFASFNKLL